MKTVNADCPFCGQTSTVVIERDISEAFNDCAFPIWKFTEIDQGKGCKHLSAWAQTQGNVSAEFFLRVRMPVIVTE